MLRTRAIIAIAASISAPATFSAAQTALADPPNEAAFLGTLRQSGVPLQGPGGTQKALQLGYLVCAGYTSGRLSEERLVSLVHDVNWTFPQKVALVTAAKATLCP